METKEEIAKRFISEHKNDNIEEWLSCDRFIQNNILSGLLNIYSNLIGGEFGDCRETDFGDFEIEISKHETKSMQTVIFSFNKLGE